MKMPSSYYLLPSSSNLPPVRRRHHYSPFISPLFALHSYSSLLFSLSPIRSRCCNALVTRPFIQNHQLFCSASLLFSVLLMCFVTTSQVSACLEPGANALRIYTLSCLIDVVLIFVLCFLNCDRRRCCGKGNGERERDRKRSQYIGLSSKQSKARQSLLPSSIVDCRCCCCGSGSGGREL